MKHYLDYNATAPVRPEVLAAMQELQGMALNASSVHALGRRAKGIVEDARRNIAETVSAFANEVIFTASGTEVNNWVLRAFTGHALVISAIEHSSVFKTAHAITQPSIIPVTPDGVVDVQALERLLALPLEGGGLGGGDALKEHPHGSSGAALAFARSPLKREQILVSVMLANNETGVIQPVRAIADIVHAKGGLMHCDAVQAFGKIPVNFSELGCDLMTLSAHKMGGPVGAAALIVRNNLPLRPMLIGGGQELNRRAGTENIAAIAGFAKAAELIDFTHMKKVRTWLDGMEKNIIGGTLPPSALHADSPAGSSYRTPPRTLAMPGIFGRSAPRLPNTTCITMPGVASETQLISFDLEGIAVSAGSACSSGRVEPSHVLKAMGVEDTVAATAIRISGGWATVQKDIDAFTLVWQKLFALKNSASL